MVVHFGKKLALDRIFRNRTNDRVNTALRAKRSFTVINPVLNLVRWEHSKAVKAAAQIALMKIGAVPDRPICEQ